jgi:hypothetical protein
MRRKVWLAFFVVPLLAFSTVSEVAADQGEGARAFTAVLSGSDLNGTAEITINLGISELCWDVEYETTQQVTAAHIHQGVAGVNGPVVFGFYNSTITVNEGCRSGDPVLLAKIAAHPGDYYVNVHTTVHPGGAARGQLRAEEEQE